MVAISPPATADEVQLPDSPLPVEQMPPTLPYGVGVDTHKAFIQACILYQTPTATCRIEQEFQTTWPDLARARQWIIDTLTEKGHWKEGDMLRYTIESTGCYHMPVCHAFGGQPTIINPMLAGPTRRKTDVLDARMLAHHSIIALWRPSYVLPEQAETLRCLIAMRNEAQRNASRIINRVNNHALRFGHTLGRSGSLADMQRRAVIEDLCRGNSSSGPEIGPNGIPADARRIFIDSYKLYDMYRAQLASYHKDTLNFMKNRQWPIGKGTIDGKTLLKNLMSCPSVGEVTALTWLSVIHDPRRFADKKQVAAFCGSDPSVKVSAGKTTSHIKRKGNARLHHVLKNCASQLVRSHKDPLGQWGYNLLRRHRKGSWGRAISAVARRLAICLWHVHRTGFEFSYEQYRFMLAVEVEEMPIEAMDIQERYKSMLTEAQLKTTGDVSRAFLTTLPQQKGLGVGCLTAVKEWLDAHRVNPVPVSNPAASSAPSPPSPPALPAKSPPSPSPSGSASRKRQAESVSVAPSSGETVPTCPPTPKPASSASKSRTASKRTR